jgi:tRNA U34 2-thiouridine synthase MnmA/TrmU
MVRYRATPAAAQATLEGDGTLYLRFDEALRAITPGQLVALFDEHDEVLGAGTIRDIS